ncbi:MAG: glycosyltransferase [Deltaproteobacteria bacterium]|nr:glycosyltransferase [Deltaproteobacteria bacterium]
MTPLVTIVCLTYNRRDFVLRCLESCLRQDYPHLEILMIVNASSDGTEEAIRRKFPQAKIICTHTNLGIFPALNLAIANALGDYIMNVDDDAYFVDSDAITRLVRAFDEDPMLGAVTCNLEGPTETPINGSDQYVHTFPAGFTLLPRKVFTEWVGYYPDFFFRDAGETYISTALWDMGKPIKKLWQVRMYHWRVLQGRSDWDWKFHGLRSQILVTLMREPWYLVVPILASKWLKSLVQYVRWRHFSTWAWAWISALFHVRVALRLRRPIRWRTRKLLWRLYNQPISEARMLTGLGLG